MVSWGGVDIIIRFNSDQWFGVDVAERFGSFAMVIELVLAVFLCLFYAGGFVIFHQHLDSMVPGSNHG